jgi:transposase InsO family protein/transposase-like protein
MRHNQAEKMEIIRLVEESPLPVKQTLKELNICRSTFYDWYRRYNEEGIEGLADRKPTPRRFWNRIPDPVREQIVDIALEYPEKSPRELAWHITDTQEYFISESSVYRILKSYDLITSPAYIVVSASDKFHHPTKEVNELWQTDFSYFKIIHWGWYYLCTVMDDFSRYILSWRLTPTMATDDVEQTLDLALKKTGVDEVQVRHRPRLLSDNGPCYVSKQLKDYLSDKAMTHIRSAPYHPQTQGKIERYHRSLKNVVTLDNYYFPGDLELSIGEFVEYYNNHRYHESLDNLTPSDVYHGRGKKIQTMRDYIKEKTLKLRRLENLGKGVIGRTKKSLDLAESVS